LYLTPVITSYNELSLAETEVDQRQLSSFNMQKLTERAFNEMGAKQVAI